jgi:PAS domain S-box-containing protein
LTNNQANARLLGATSPSEIIGKTVFDFFLPKTAQAYDADDRTVIQSGLPVIEREERFSVNGKSGWFATTKVPLRDADGRLVGLVGITTDITDRKLTESHKTALANLGQKLSAAKTAKEAGGVIVEAADQLFGWDCCTLDMYSARSGGS